MATLTLSDLRTGVYSALDNNTRLYTAAQVNAAVNDGIRVTNLLTGFYQIRVTLTGTTQPNRFFYRVPQEVIVAMNVYLDMEPLFKSSFAGISAAEPDWLRRRASSSRPPSRWAPVGLRTFAIAPADHRGGRLITVGGVGEVPLLVNDSDEITLSDEHAEMATDLAYHVLPLKCSGAEMALVASAYQGVLRKAKDLRMWQSYKNPVYFVELESKR